MNRSFWRSVASSGLLLLAVLMFTLQGHAQQTLGSLNGTVVDPSGAAIPGAIVVVTNSAIGVTRTVKSQADGFYQIFNLPVGTYTVKVSHEGFDSTQMSNIAIQEAHAQTLPVSLKIGHASESVEVTANPLLNATDATNGYTLDAAQIEITPLA